MKLNVQIYVVIRYPLYTLYTIISRKDKAIKS